MIERKLRRPRKEKKVGLNLRLDEDEFEFIHEVKDKLGCTMSGYIRFLIHRSTYEDLKKQSKSDQRAMRAVSLLIKEKKLTKTYRLIISETEHAELERVNLERGIPKNTHIRWLLRRRMMEYKHLSGHLFDIV
jgi:hypothetical protein